MPIQIVRNDIVRMQVDAIVNTANPTLTDSAGVNGAIRRAAGPGMAQACARLGGCRVGEAKITPGFELPCRYVIHTVAPRWRAGRREKVAACYTHALELALQHGCRSIAFPLIASGAQGCPQAEALGIALEAIGEFLMAHVPENDLLVSLVVFTSRSVQLSQQLVADVHQFVDDRYVEEHLSRPRELLWNRRMESDSLDTEYAPLSDAGVSMPAKARLSNSLQDALRHIDESFSQMISRLLREKKMKNAACYKRANIDRKLFSKIVNNVHYAPKKTTALAMAIALELSLEETRELLMKAGYALSRSDKTDIIVEYFITQGRYDIFEINEVLYEFDLMPLGSVIL